MNFDHRPEKILITGASGSGKTTLYLKTLAGWRSRWKFVFDPDRETARKLRWPVCSDVAGMNQCAANLSPVCFDPSVMFPGQREEGFAFFSRWVLNVSRALNGPKLLAVDELQNYTFAGRTGIPQAFREVLDVGRREEIDLLIISQRPNELNHAIRSQLTKIITFAHVDILPLEFLAYQGFNPEDVSRLKCPGGWLQKNLRSALPPSHDSAPVPPRKGNSLQNAAGRKKDGHRG